MINVARIPPWVMFLALLVPTMLMQADWKFSAVAWVILLAWYVLMRVSLSASTRFLRNPVYLLCATISFVYPPILAIVGIVVGDQELSRLFDRYAPYAGPFHMIALVFVFYSAWTAARELVTAESKTAADRAVRWERTWKPFFQLLVWPIGVWFVQKRYQAVSG